MLNRDQIAHEYMLQILGRENSKLGFQDAFETFSKGAFDIADLMIAEAQKRQNLERPAILNDDYILVPKNPTAEMLIAGESNLAYGEDAVYQAMLGAIK